MYTNCKSSIPVNIFSSVWFKEINNYNYFTRGIRFEICKILNINAF